MQYLLHWVNQKIECLIIVLRKRRTQKRRPRNEDHENEDPENENPSIGVGDRGQIFCRAAPPNFISPYADASFNTKHVFLGTGQNLLYYMAGGEQKFLQKISARPV